MEHNIAVMEAGKAPDQPRPRRIRARRHWDEVGLLSTVVLGLVALSGGVVFSQEKKRQPSAEDMAAWEAVNKPGPHHKHLDDMVGEWEAAGKWWTMGPMSPPMEVKGHSKMHLIFGGRFLVDDYESSMPGPDGKPMPFQGMGIFGYDNVKQKHNGIWLDSMSCGMLCMEGPCEEGCKAVTLEGKYAMAEGMWGWRSTMRQVDKDHMEFVAFNVAPEGVKVSEGAPREHKAMELHYTRKK